MKRPVAIAVLALLVATPAAPVRACSIQIIDVDDTISAMLAQPDELGVPREGPIGILQRKVVKIWLPTETHAGAAAWAPIALWGSAEYSPEPVIVGGDSLPTTTSSCATGPRTLGATQYLAVYQARPDRPVLLNSRPVSIEDIGTFTEVFGRPLAIPVPDFPEAHPYRVPAPTDATSTTFAVVAIGDPPGSFPWGLLGLGLAGACFLIAVRAHRLVSAEQRADRGAEQLD